MTSRRAALSGNTSLIAMHIFYSFVSHMPKQACLARYYVYIVGDEKKSLIILRHAEATPLF